ncbi:MAG: CpaD family pilus assembly protein [Croceibacterium sp.]
MPIQSKSAAAAAIALSLGLVLSGCNTTQDNRSLYSVKQPVVERSNFTLDVDAGAAGLPISEQRRLAGWFETMDLRYGDRVAVDGPITSAAVRNDVAAIASRHGILLSDGAPVTSGYVDPGKVRIVVTRSHASVPGCPDWSDHFANNLQNAASEGFGCAVNGNFASMVADPQHLLNGAEGSGDTVVMSSTKAIESYRSAVPTGSGGLKSVSTSSGSGSSGSN